MIHTIQNEYLTVKIHEKGATLWSIMDKDGTEYLWQGDEQYWKDRAPNLFPYIARMTKGRYTLKGKTYKMDIHGHDLAEDFENAINCLNLKDKIDIEKAKEQFNDHVKVLKKSKQFK